MAAKAGTNVLTTKLCTEWFNKHLVPKFLTLASEGLTEHTITSDCWIAGQEDHWAFVSEHYDYFKVIAAKNKLSIDRGKTAADLYLGDPSYRWISFSW